MPSSLIISFKQLGDTLLLQPALEALARQAGSPVSLRCPPSFAPMVRLMPGAKLPEPGARYDDLWVFEHGSKAAFAAFRTRARRKHLRILREAYRRWYHPLVFSDIQPQPLDYAYRALNNFRAVLGATDGFAPPRLSPPPGGAPLPGIPAGAVLINPTSAWETKAWTAASWAALIDAIAPLPVALVGQGEGWAAAQVREILSLAKSPVHDLVNRTSLDQLLALVANARAVIAIDGAVAHIAAAFSRPVLVLFGPTRAGEWCFPSPSTISIRASDFDSARRPSPASIPVKAVLDKTGDLFKIAACLREDTGRTGSDNTCASW